MKRKAEFGDSGQFPMYTDDEGSTLFDLRDLLQQYHSSMWDPIYAIQSRDMVNPSNEELSAVKSLLEDITAGVYDESLLGDPEDESDSQDDYSIAYSWLPTIERLIFERSEKENDDGRKTHTLARVRDKRAQEIIPELDIPDISELEQILEPEYESDDFDSSQFLKQVMAYAKSFSNRLKVETDYRKGELGLYFNKGKFHGRLTIQQIGSDDYWISGDVYEASRGGVERSIWTINHEDTDCIMGAGCHVVQAIDFVVDIIEENAPKNKFSAMDNKLLRALELCAQVLDPELDIGSDGSVESNIFPDQIIAFAKQLADGEQVEIEYTEGDTSLYIYFVGNNIQGALDIQYEEGDENFTVSADVTEFIPPDDSNTFWSFPQTAVSFQELTSIIAETAYRTYEPAEYSSEDPNDYFPSNFFGE